MGKRRSVLNGLLAILLIAYMAVAVTPLKAYIGRHSPAAASWFSPFLFNFWHTYENGSVLTFTVGMTKTELFEMLTKSYAGRAQILVACTSTPQLPFLEVTPDLDIAAVYGGGSNLCVDIDPREQGFIFVFDNELVSAIEVWFVRMEGT